MYDSAIKNKIKLRRRISPNILQNIIKEGPVIIPVLNVFNALINFTFPEANDSVALRL